MKLGSFDYILKKDEKIEGLVTSKGLIFKDENGFEGFMDRLLNLGISKSIEVIN